MKWLKKEKKIPVLDEDFEFVDHRDSNDRILRTSIKILTGKFKDIVYHYGRVGVNENADAPMLSYQYVVSKEGKHDVKKLHNDEEFVTLMGDILVEIFDKHLDMNSLEEINEPTGIDNTEKPTLQ